MICVIRFLWKTIKERVISKNFIYYWDDLCWNEIDEIYEILEEYKY